VNPNNADNHNNAHNLITIIVGDKRKRAAQFNNKQTDTMRTSGHVTPGIKSQTQEKESHRITKGMTGIQNVKMGVKCVGAQEGLSSWFDAEKSYWATRSWNMQ